MPIPTESEKRTAQLVGTCDDLFNKIQALVDNMTNMDAAQIAASQQEISKTVNELCAMLRQQAKECENPAMAEQLIMLSKVLKDKVSHGWWLDELCVSSCSCDCGRRLHTFFFFFFFFLLGEGRGGRRGGR